MEGISTTKCELELDMNGTLGKDILKYGMHLSEIKSFTLRELWKNEKKDYEARYQLPFGITNLYFEDTKIEIHYTRDIARVVGTAHYAEYPVTLKVICYDTEKVLTKFLVAAKNFTKHQKENKIICRILKNGYWSYLNKLPRRKSDSVFLPKKQKESVLADVKGFLKKQELYEKYGIPYKRNYLLEGMPGCGKTTLILTIATELNMDVAIVNFGPKISDSVFMNAVSNLQKDTILVLEDIDSLFLKRESTRENKSAVSFSGVLNILDGLARNEGLITFMTTNYPDRLDSALVRPGRIDYKIHFDYATKDQVKEMYKFFFPDKLDRFDEIYKEIKRYKTTTSVLQKFFFENLEEDNLLKKIDLFIKLSEDSNKHENYKNLYT
jgi:hypothetical protein